MHGCLPTCQRALSYHAVSMFIHLGLGLCHAPTDLCKRKNGIAFDRVIDNVGFQYSQLQSICIICWKLLHPAYNWENCHSASRDLLFYAVKQLYRRGILVVFISFSKNILMVMLYLSSQHIVGTYHFRNDVDRALLHFLC